MIELIKSSVERIPEDSNWMRKIESAARTCYKSEAKMTADSAEKFVRGLCSKGHTAMCEHATLYFKCPQGIASSPWWDLMYSHYSWCTYDDDTAYITTNFRVVLEEAFNGKFDDAVEFIKKHAIEPTEEHERRVSFRIICDRGVSHELVRHRVFSFAQESTRYVRYADKPTQIIEPAWWQDEYVKTSGVLQPSIAQNIFTTACESALDSYATLLSLGQTPQQARAVLPNAIKTEVVMTGTVTQWQEFLKLRNAPTAHPDMQIIAKMISEELPLEVK